MTPEHESLLQGTAGPRGRSDRRRPLCAIRSETARDLSWLGGRRQLESYGVSSGLRLHLRYFPRLRQPEQDGAVADGTTFSRVGATGAPANSGGRFWDGAKQWPCQKPPWGEILAVNVNTGDIAWRMPLGAFDELDALGVPKTGTPEPRGGPIATAGGVHLHRCGHRRPLPCFGRTDGQGTLGRQAGGRREGHADYVSGQEW